MKTELKHIINPDLITTANLLEGMPSIEMYGIRKGVAGSVAALIRDSGRLSPMETKEAGDLLSYVLLVIAQRLGKEYEREGFDLSVGMSREMVKSFQISLFMLIQQADPMNRERLRSIYPFHVGVIEEQEKETEGSEPEQLGKE